MSIQNDIKNDYTTNHVRPLSKQEVDLFLTEDTVKYRLKNGESPILLSIEKWERIYYIFSRLNERYSLYKYYDSFLEHLGQKSCALCIESKNQYISRFGSIKYHEDKCKLCPFSEIDRCIDDNSTYNKIERLFEFKPYDLTKHNNEELDKVHSKLNENIKHMIKNLRKLLV